MRFHNAGMMLGLSIGIAAAGQDQKPNLPDGPGKEAVERVCSHCHDLDTVIGSRRTRTGWQQMVEDMAARGADGSEEDLAAIVSYLTASFGKVNVNTANAAELEKIAGFSAGEAQAVIDYRERNGKISNFEQLTQVPGLSAEKLQTQRPRIAFAQ